MLTLYVQRARTVVWLRVERAVSLSVNHPNQRGPTCLPWQRRLPSNWATKYPYTVTTNTVWRSRYCMWELLKAEIASLFGEVCIHIAVYLWVQHWTSLRPRLVISIPSSEISLPPPHLQLQLCMIDIQCGNWLDRQNSEFYFELARFTCTANVSVVIHKDW